MLKTLGAAVLAISAIALPSVAASQTESAAPLTALDDYTIYFDTDSAVITKAGQSLIKAKTSDWLEMDSVYFALLGHDDSAKSADESQAVSLKRANAIADFLKSMGVSEDRIKIRAFGETAPAKPTPDGTSEPLNRRVRIGILVN